MFRLISYTYYGKSISLLYIFVSSDQCSPCLVAYDAIVKLDVPGEDRDLLSYSNLDRFVSPDDEFFVHQTVGGPTSQHREEYFKDIPCSLIQNLTERYLMDLEMFQYGTHEFLKICKI